MNGNGKKNITAKHKHSKKSKSKTPTTMETAWLDGYREWKEKQKDSGKNKK